MYSRTTILVLIYSALIAYISTNVAFTTSGVPITGGLFHVNPTTQLFHIFLYLLSSVIIGLTAFYPRKLWIEKHSGFLYTILHRFSYANTSITNKMGQQFRIIEYPLILLFIITGGVFIISSNDIVSIFLSIELQSYGLYLLATLYKNSELSTSAGLTYFLLGGLSSCFILLGITLLYVNCGTTSLEAYYVIITICNITNDYTLNLLNYDSIYINISLLIMSVGFLFKVSAAPFHFWSPDVYDALPTIVTTFVAIVAKISILAFLINFVNHTNSIIYSTSFFWTYGILISSFMSLIIGSILGLTQVRIKRLFAYSTISHIGFILLALAINKSESIQAFIFYLTQYSISNLNAFIILIAIGYSLYPYVRKEKTAFLPERNNTPIQLISELKGLFYINPLLAVSLSITLFSFAGIPPLAGFFAKQMVLSTALDNGFIFISIVAILTSVISAAYYLNVIKQIFFDDTNLTKSKETTSDCIITDYTLKGTKVYSVKFDSFDSVKLSSFLTITISILTLVILLFMFGSNEWLSMSRLLSLLIFNI